MDPSPEEISALADQLSQLAKDMAATKDPISRKVQVQNLCLEAQKMIRAIQDPVQGMMDTVTTVRNILKSKRNLLTTISDLRRVCRARAHGA